MLDRLRVRGALGRGAPIEVVVEDGFDRAVGPGADIEGALGGRLQTRGSVMRNPRDPERRFHGIVSSLWKTLAEAFADNPRSLWALVQQRGVHTNREIVDAENPRCPAFE